MISKKPALKTSQSGENGIKFHTYKLVSGWGWMQTRNNRALKTQSVDHGEPASPQLTCAERQARIDEITESNIHRRLSDLEKLIPDAHVLENTEFEHH